MSTISAVALKVILIPTSIGTVSDMKEDSLLNTRR